ncbi:MAG: phosphoribosyltransferase family protein [Coriobacteriales bacterium]|nr:phosphoribosyltransferase family protein [Coriobacteriales bacterium]
MDVRRLLKGATGAAEELLWPTRCVSCDMPGELLCEECRDSMPWIAQRWACPVCGAPFGWLTCTSCKGGWEQRATICALGFEQTSSQMVACLKDRFELRLAGVNAAAMATALDEAGSWPALDGAPRYDASNVDALCFVPATSAAFARRGFDHMELVARELQRFVDLPLFDVLARTTGRDQRKLGREERAKNLRGSVEVIDDVAGMRLLLVDDVITTGASMREATRALLARGASEVTCCALTRVW